MISLSNGGIDIPTRGHQKGDPSVTDREDDRYNDQIVSSIPSRIRLVFFPVFFNENPARSGNSEA
jgi:hypothetical protein